MKKIIFLSILSLLVITSCVTKKDMVYLQSSDSTSFVKNDKNLITFKSGDILYISFMSEDERATSPLNPVGTYFSGPANPNTPFIPTYTVDKDGFVELPKLGKIKVLGLTRLETIKKLKTLAEQYIHNPVVNVKLHNFRITVLGEVKSPGVYTVENDRITLLEALGLAGDLNIGAVRKNILLIREENGIKTEYRIDLTNAEVLNSSIYYLAQNDVIYVEPNKATVNGASYSRSSSIFLSIAGLALTVITLLTR